MNRGTETITTSSKHVVVANGYMTAGEAREVNKVYMKDMKMEMVDGKAQMIMSDMTAELTSKAQDKTLELSVIELDGDKENILKRLLELPKRDFDEVVAFVDSLNGLNEEKKTT